MKLFYLKGACSLASHIMLREVGETFEIEGDALLARCLLHENDHVSGQLLVDFVGPLKRQMIKRRLKREGSAAEV